MVCTKFHHILSLNHTPKMHTSPDRESLGVPHPPRCTQAPDRGSLGVPHPPSRTAAPDRESLGVPHTPKMHKSPGPRESWLTTPTRCTEALDRITLVSCYKTCEWTLGVAMYWRIVTLLYHLAQLSHPHLLVDSAGGSNDYGSDWMLMGFLHLFTYLHKLSSDLIFYENMVV